MLDRSPSIADDKATAILQDKTAPARLRPRLGDDVTLSPAASSPADDATDRKNMSLLIQLRWTAVIGQIVTIGAVHLWLGAPLPVVPMGAVVLGLIALNIGSLAWMRYRVAVSNRDLLIALILDVVALTAQLYLSGGITNPFTSLYLLQVTLGAVLLDSRASWSLVAVVFAAFIWLTGASRPLVLPQTAGDPVNLTVAGMLIGFALNAVLLVVFVTRIHRNLRERDAHLG